MKNNKGIIAVLIIIIIALAAFCGLLATGIVSFTPPVKCKEDTSVETTNTDTNSCSCKSYISRNYGCGVDDVDFDKLSEISKGDYNYIKGVYNGQRSINVLSDGKVIIDFDKYVSNIENAKDIILFGDVTEAAYILTTDGNVYKYELSSIDNSNFEAEKLNEYSNIKYMTTYMTRRANAGGCNYLVLIDGNDKYYKLDYFCH